MKKPVPDIRGLVAAASVLLAVLVGVLLGLAMAMAMAVIARLWGTGLSDLPI